MIDAAAIVEIIALYKKHGWTLRRVLLSERLRSGLSTDAMAIFADVELKRSELDGAWFSRSSRPDCTAWEIRHLSETPFALVEVVDDADSEHIDELLGAAEAKMIATLANRPDAV